MARIRSRGFSPIYLTAVLFALLCLTLTSCSEPPEKKSREERPNILFILADDLGYGDVQIYFPASKMKTPNIDALARTGMRFTDAHSGAAVCSPTRYGVLTGQHFLRRPWDSIREQLSESMIDDGRLTVGELLQENGYHTGAFGKWHLGQTFYDKNGEPIGPSIFTDWSRPTVGGPNDHGFDDFFGVAFGQTQTMQALMSNRHTTAVPTAVTEKGVVLAEGYEPWHAMPEITQKALDYIDWNAQQRPGEPFFLYYAPPAIHLPLVPSPEFAGKSDTGPYGDFVQQTDAAVGKLIARLEERGLRENTLVIFTSDNGAHGVAGNGPFSQFPRNSMEDVYGHKANADWRGYKGTLWEGGHRVPFIASWPGVIAADSVSDELIALEDFMATTAAIVNVELPKNAAEDSFNLLPYLDGSHEGKPIREYAVLSSFNGSPVLRTRQWAIAFRQGPGLEIPRNTEPPKQGARGQLYDLDADPRQTKNLWNVLPQVVAELTALYDEHVRRGRSLGIDR